jgi:hypothetical protein
MLRQLASFAYVLHQLILCLLKLLTLHACTHTGGALRARQATRAAARLPSSPGRLHRCSTCEAPSPEAHGCSSSQHWRC